MPDSPDYSKYLPGSPRFSLNDMGELAARLGSPVTYDRRGEVIYYYTMDMGMSGYGGTYSGAGADIYINTNSNSRWGYSTVLKTGTDGQMLAGIYSFFGVLHPVPLGLEVSAAFTNNFDKFWISLYRGDGSNIHIGRLGISKTNNVIFIQDSTGNEITIDSLPEPINAYFTYQRFKIVCDLNTDKYIRAIYNQKEYDLSSYSVWVFAAPDMPSHRWYVRHHGNAGVASHAHVESIIVTSNEPT